MKSINYFFCIVLAVVSMYSCSKSSDTSAPAAPALHFEVGQAYQGGIIAYVDVTGAHGLIAAPSDIAFGAWSNFLSDTLVGASGTMIGTGKANTAAIVKVLGPYGFAAGLCDAYELNGYSDWYLPSKDELNQLYRNKVAIGSFKSDFYWSSSEGTKTGAWMQSFSSGTASSAFKKSSLYVRPVRSF